MPTDVTPKSPWIYYSRSGAGMIFRFEVKDSTATGYNFQYGPSCDQLNSGVIAVTGDTHTVESFPYVGQAFCLSAQSVNGSATSNWVQVDSAGQVVSATGTTTTAATTTTGNAVDPNTGALVTAAGMPVSGVLTNTFALLALGFALVCLALRKLSPTVTS